MNVYRALIILITSGLSVGSLFGAEPLQWEQHTIEVTTSPKQKTVEVAFAFTNTSEKPVTIKSVEPSCDCTTAELKKKTFAPREKGQIDVVFNVADSQGPQFKTIAVTTEENPNEPIDLTLKVQIPLPVEIAPRLLTWRVNAEATEKSVDISLLPDPVITVTGAKSKEPGMEARLETLVPNRQYRLFVKPVSTAVPLRSTFIITTVNAASALPETHLVYAQVR
jgi:hypothetical protein